MNKEKMFGYILLCIGLICIIFALFCVYKVFTKAAKPPEIFQMQTFTFFASSETGISRTEFTIPLDPEVREIVNLLLYYLFMFFIAVVGARLCSLGIQFIKEIKIREEE